jgi:hypothetical protein
MTTLQVFDEKLRRPVADARLASISFVSAKEFAGVPADQRIPKLRSMADAVFTAAVIGSFIIVRDKKSVIELVLEDRQSFSNARLELAKAADEARGILEVISLAQRRLTAAFAAIERNNSATKA